MWERLCGEIGVAGLAVPEEYGGAGAGPAEIQVVAEELGRELTPTPLLGSAVLAAQAVLASGDTAACARLLPGIAAGTTIAALAWATETGRWDPAAAPYRARRAAGPVSPGGPGRRIAAGQAGGAGRTDGLGGEGRIGAIGGAGRPERADGVRQTGGARRADGAGRLPGSGTPARTGDSMGTGKPARISTAAGAGDAAGAREAPGSTPQHTPDGTPQHTPDGTAQHTPDGTAQHTPDGTPRYVLDGTAHYVLYGDSADVLLVVARAPDGTGLFEVDPAQEGVTRTPAAAVDPATPLAVVGLAGAAGRRIGARDASAALARARDLAAIALSGEQVGAARRALELTVDHTAMRVQFGRPIGSFQAVQHRLADLYVLVESARSAAYAAAEAAAGTAPGSTAPGGAAPGQGPAGLEMAAATARMACTDALNRAAAEMIQLHGAIGITWEHAAHRYLKRAHSSARLLGPPAGYLARVAAALLDP